MVRTPKTRKINSGVCVCCVCICVCVYPPTETVSTTEGKRRRAMYFYLFFFFCSAISNQQGDLVLLEYNTTTRPACSSFWFTPKYRHHPSLTTNTLRRDCSSSSSVLQGTTRDFRQYGGEGVVEIECILSLRERFISKLPFLDLPKFETYIRHSEFSYDDSKIFFKKNVK